MRTQTSLHALVAMLLLFALVGYSQSADKVKKAEALIEESTTLIESRNAQTIRTGIEKAKQANEIYVELRNGEGQAASFHLIGMGNYYLSNYRESISAFSFALSLSDKVGESYRTDFISTTLYNLGKSYQGTGDYENAILHYERSKKLSGGNKYGLATINATLCILYADRGDFGKALAIADEALGLFDPTIDKQLAAVIYNNIAYVYLSQIEKQPILLSVNAPKALEYLKKADPIYSEMCTPKSCDPRQVAPFLANVGKTLEYLNDLDTAIERYKAALALAEHSGDLGLKAKVLINFAAVYQRKGDVAKSIELFDQSIPLFENTGDRASKAAALSYAMVAWHLRKNPRFAVFYGKQAIAEFQNLRLLNDKLDTESKKKYLATLEPAYRILADILVQAGRLPEAQQVLDLLKEEEYLDFVRRDATEASVHAKIALTDAERKALDEYARLSDQLTSLGARFQVLQDSRVKSGGKLSDADEAEFQKLKIQIEEAGVGIRTFLSKLAAEFSKKVEDQAVITPESIETLRADLRRAGPDVVLVSTYLLPERYRAIVTTGRAMVDRKVEYKDRKLTAADINRKIDEFRRALQNPKVDPRPLGKELYDIFVKPLESDLKGAGAKTILWSLDGTLRYIPIAALSPDGKTYLVEHYQNVIVTLARQSKLFEKPTDKEWRALGAGVSKQHEGFPALPSVINELNSIVRENGTGVLDGKKLVDENFNLKAFQNSVPQQTEDGKVFNVIHLATHFKLGLNDQDSALLLGDGKRLSLFDIGKDEGLDFKDVELLALSACETGVAAGDKTGREVESLGMLAQKKGAKAVLATLWKVADEGTSMFMSEFYRLKLANPQMNKSEAIRLTQKAMIDGKIKASGTSTSCRSDEFVDPAKKDGFKCDPNAPFSHPYFWSPFVLIGNWR